MSFRRIGEQELSHGCSWPTQSPPEAPPFISKPRIAVPQSSLGIQIVNNCPRVAHPRHNTAPEAPPFISQPRIAAPQSNLGIQIVNNCPGVSHPQHNTALDPPTFTFNLRTATPQSKLGIQVANSSMELLIPGTTLHSKARLSSPNHESLPLRAPSESSS